MRVLLTAHGAYGHVLPLVATAHALQRAGHDVRFAVAGELHPTLGGLGLEAHAAGLGDSALVAEARRRWPEAVREPPARWAVRMFTDIAAPAMARDVRAIIDAWRPHLVVREEGEYGAPIAATGAGVPWITHGWGSPPVATARGRYGAGFLDRCPPSLRAARVESPTWSIRPSVVEPPAGAEPTPTGDGEVVYVGFGTVPLYRDDPRLLTMVVGTLVAAGFRAVVTTSEPTTAAALAAVDRARVGVRQWVSLSRLLPACRLAVCHGGAGTVLAALTAGIPLLLLPRGAPSQARMSAACAERGVARALTPDEVSAAAVEAALVELVSEDRFRQHAATVAREIAQMPSPDSAVPPLERLARKR